MGRSLSNDEQALIDLIGDIYEAALDAGRWEAVCWRLADFFGATGSTLQINDVIRGSMPLFVSSGIDPAAAGEYAAEFASSDPRVAFASQQVVGGLMYDGLHITPEEMARHPYYAFLQKWGFRYYGGGVLLQENDLTAMVTFQRSAQQGHVDDGDIAYLQRLLPHLSRAMQLTARLHTLSQRPSEQALERVPFGVALLGYGGDVIYLNAEARRIVASDEGLAAGAAGLCAVRAVDDAPLQRLIGTAIAVAEGRMVDGGGVGRVEKRTSPRPYAVQVTALPGRSTGFAIGAPAAIVFIIDPDRPVVVDVDVLMRAYGLTRAEAGICAKLLQGMTAGEIAAATGVGQATVRRHLEAIFRKTGTRRQSDLCRLLLPLAGLASTPGDDNADKP